MVGRTAEEVSMRGRRVLTLKNARLPSLFNGAINKGSQRQAPIPTPSFLPLPLPLPYQARPLGPHKILRFFSETEMALDSVPSYPSDLGSSRARTPQQQRVRYISMATILFSSIDFLLAAKSLPMCMCSS